jgi:hypothetical protein
MSRLLWINNSHQRDKRLMLKVFHNLILSVHLNHFLISHSRSPLRYTQSSLLLWILMIWWTLKWRDFTYINNQIKRGVQNLKSRKMIWSSLVLLSRIRIWSNLVLLIWSNLVLLSRIMIWSRLVLSSRVKRLKSSQTRPWLILHNILRWSLLILLFNLLLSNLMLRSLFHLTKAEDLCPTLNMPHLFIRIKDHSANWKLMM